MRITISHNKSKAQAIEAVDQAVEQALRMMTTGPVRITDSQKSWEGSMMSFSMLASMGILKNRVHGTVQVTDKDLTIDADLGMLGKLFPEEKVCTALASRVRALLA
jgi:hypothetical protein